MQRMRLRPAIIQNLFFDSYMCKKRKNHKDANNMLLELSILRQVRKRTLKRKSVEKQKPNCKRA